LGDSTINVVNLVFRSQALYKALKYYGSGVLWVLQVQKPARVKHTGNLFYIILLKYIYGLWLKVVVTGGLKQVVGCGHSRLLEFGNTSATLHSPIFVFVIQLF
jgi:hypothetical protein